MGWLGYTEQETLDTAIPALLLGFKGATQKVLASLGAPLGNETPAEPPPADAVFAAMRTIGGGK